MITHIFVGTLVDGVSEEDIERLLAGWRELPKLIPEVRSLHAGRNISRRDTRYSLVLVAEFDDLAAWERYMDHRDHKAIGAELTTRLINPQSRAMVQVEY